MMKPVLNQFYDSYVTAGNDREMWNTVHAVRSYIDTMFPVNENAYMNKAAKESWEQVAIRRRVDYLRANDKR